MENLLHINADLTLDSPPRASRPHDKLIWHYCHDSPFFCSLNLPYDSEGHDCA